MSEAGSDEPYSPEKNSDEKERAEPEHIGKCVRDEAREFTPGS